jgi:hypothetical protein
MPRYTFKDFDLNQDVISQTDIPLAYQWGLTNVGTGSDDSGDKWVDTSMSSYITHCVADTTNTAAVSGSGGTILDGDLTSKSVFTFIGTNYFNMTTPASGFSWSEGTGVTAAYVVMINDNLVLDKIKAGTFRITLSGNLNASANREFILNEVTGDTYPESTTIRYADSEGALSSTNVGMAFLNDGMFVFLKSGSEGTVSGLLSAVFDGSITQTNLPTFFNAAGAGTCQAASGNSAEYENSFIYFCRGYNAEFNYSLNDTWGISASPFVGTRRIRTEFQDHPKTYATGVGLYNTAGQLLAVGKLNTPRLKDPYNESLIKVKVII